MGNPALTNDTNGKLRLLARYDAITNTVGGQVFDASGHGTHMTSVIAHNGAVTRAGEPTGSYQGVAPDVNLVAVKAFDVAGQGGFLDIVRAVQWVVDNRETYNIRVLNLSFAAKPALALLAGPDQPGNYASLGKRDNGGGGRRQRGPGPDDNRFTGESALYHHCRRCH